MATKDSGAWDTFDLIAESWYRLRHWTRFKQELTEVAERWGSGRLLNIGCAHGPDFLPFKDRFDLYGLDSSERMLEMAVKYAGKFGFPVQLLAGSAVNLPFASRSFDWAVAVAVYHHISKKDERSLAFSELHRVLKPGGEAFITVWNHMQMKFIFKGKQVNIPWKTKDGMLPRYHYLYDYAELEKKLTRHGFKLISSRSERSYRLPVRFFSRNICILVESTG